MRDTLIKLLFFHPGVKGNPLRMKHTLLWHDAHFIELLAGKNYVQTKQMAKCVFVGIPAKMFMQNMYMQNMYTLAGSLYNFAKQFCFGSAAQRPIS